MNKPVSQLGLVLVLLGTAACGASSSTASPASTTSTTAAGSPPIASVWRSRCNQCHTPVEPKTRDRAQLQAALARHHTRTRLSDAQWGEMVDYLAR